MAGIRQLTVRPAACEGARPAGAFVAPAPGGHGPPRYLGSVRRAPAALLVFVTLTLVACGGGGAEDSQRTPAPAPTTQPAPPETTTTTLDHQVFETATALGPSVPVFEAPGQTEPVRTFASPNPIYGGGAIRVFLVRENRGEWLNVWLPARPNGTTGWIRSSDVSLSRHAFRIVVDLAARRLTAYERNDVIFDEPIAVGASATPSTLGTFYTTELIIPQGQPQYGPFAWGLSAYSEVLYDFGGGDGQMGIHGTSDPSSIGRAVSNGCIRLRNDAITRLVELLPVAGVPVEIKA